jgi:hypothetical protein
MFNKDNKTSSWFSGQCKECGFPVIYTQPPDNDNENDYQWYCSCPECKNHVNKKLTGDMERPDFVVYEPR